jgi:hypothetical protein
MIRLLFCLCATTILRGSRFQNPWVSQSGVLARARGAYCQDASGWSDRRITAAQFANHAVGGQAPIGLEIVKTLKCTE